MWRIIPLKTLFAISVALSLVFGYLLYVLLPDAIQNTPQILNYVIRTIDAVPIVFVIIFFIGRSEYCWAKCNLAHKLYPNLSGTWEGTIDSTSSTPGTGTLITMRISQTWGNIKVDTTSNAQVSNSTTKTIEAFPELHYGKPILWIVFEGKVKNPEPSDSPTYFGTSRAEYDSESGDLIVNYWTNRAWNQGMNTAGSITLTRKN